MKVIKTETEKYKESAKRVLKHAMKREYRTVYVLGMDEEGIMTMHSSENDTLKTLGAIELIKALYVEGLA